MVFKYRELNQAKYKDIYSPRWNQQRSLIQRAQETTHLLGNRKNNFKRKILNLNAENQLYLQKRLKTESFA